MMWPEGFFFPHTVVVVDAGPAGGLGRPTSPRRTLAAEVRDEQRIVRDKDAAEVVSNTNVTVHLNAAVPLESRVTVWAGMPEERSSRVIAVRRDENPPPLTSHLILYLE